MADPTTIEGDWRSAEKTIIHTRMASEEAAPTK